MTSCTLDRSGSVSIGALGGDSAGGAQGVGGRATGGDPSGGSGGGTGGEIPSCTAGHCIELPADSSPVVRGDGRCEAGWTVLDPNFLATNPGCEACTCSAPVDGTCSLLDISTHGGVACGNGNTVVLDMLTPGECVSPGNNPDSYTTGAAVPSVGSCKPSASAPVALQQVHLCEPISELEACGRAGVCAPPDPAQFCVLLPEGTSCPTNLPNATTIAASATDDERECECACDPAPGASCSGTELNVFDTNDCSGGVAGTVPANTNQCTTIEGMSDQSVNLTPGTWAGDPCPVVEQHSGSVTFAGSQILCCST